MEIPWESLDIGSNVNPKRIFSKYFKYIKYLKYIEFLLLITEIPHYCPTQGNKQSLVKYPHQDYVKHIIQ